MIQFNNVASSLSMNPKANSAAQAALDSFQTELSQAITETLQKFGISPGSVNISISPTPQSTPSASTSTPSSSSTLTPQAAAPAQGPAVSKTTAKVSNSNLGPFEVAIGNTGADSPVVTMNADVQVDPQTAFNNNYWAKQPEAVRQLRDIGDPDQRAQTAANLAGQGYAIDVPIMSWGWDPYHVTNMRQGYGYTWVPSALQAPVRSAPGITLPGVTAYDPNNPPAGSIMV